MAIIKNMITVAHTNVAALILRVGVGLMMAMGHGWGKLSNFELLSEQFPDPLGIGIVVSLALAVFAEFFCAIAVVLGYKTRFAVIPLMVTMIVAIFVVHASDPWMKKELAAMYLVSFLTLFFTGAGKYSLDGRA